MLVLLYCLILLFLFNHTATTEIYTLSLHDALPICGNGDDVDGRPVHERRDDAELIRNDELLRRVYADRRYHPSERSEEHTSELQSPYDLVCRLLLEKKKKIIIKQTKVNQQYQKAQL